MVECRYDVVTWNFHYQPYWGKFQEALSHYAHPVITPLEDTDPDTDEYVLLISSMAFSQTEALELYERWKNARR